ncbi:MAG: type II toxin-antitoxin system HipA family toxin [Gammaproteobacteria bacterium]|nr:type II toxin-antitoxin system HipA family toxin [Gammaproteobacteria bacterium]
MKKKQLSVFLHDIYVGELVSQQGKLCFSYDKEYLQLPTARPISMTMPLSHDIYTHSIVAPYFSGLLPDEGVRYRLAKYLQISEKNIFGLLEAIGGECAGAVSIKPHPTSKGGQESNYIVLENQEALDVMRSLENRPFLVGEDDIRISAAGAQCKLMIAFIDGKIAIPKGTTPSTHIIKPNIPGFNDTVFNEFFCMILAKRIGLICPNVQIYKINQTSFYVVERYDRTIYKGQITRLHQEDFCQILNIPPEIKYENEGGPSISDCFNVMDEFIQSGRMPGIDKLRLLKLMIFNFLIGNTDAHGKNFSVVYQKNGVSLAPCYDLLSTVIYSTHGKDKMAMKIGGEYQLRLIQARHWHKLAQQIGFRESFVIQQVKKMALDINKELSFLQEKMDNSKGILDKMVGVIQNQVERVQSHY